MPPTRCPEPARFQQLLHGDLTDAEQAAVTTHLDECAACQQTLERLAAGSGFWPAPLKAAGELPHADPALRQVINELKGGAVTDKPHLHPAGEVELGFLQPADQPGYLGRLGHYAISGVVGRGGMGVVLKAFDESLHRVVAIKVMAEQLATSATARQRFTREARAAAGVCHEHVVTIHAVEDAGGLPYIVMQYVAGCSLQERIDRTGPMGLKEILRIGMQTAEGLAAAHKQGLVHRDVKPANILLENGVERVKLTDFGLARAVDDASLTQSGVAAGTPQYMAPEQAEGGRVDHRADLFSLGSVLYAMCTGRPPFRASGTMAVLKRVCEDTPRRIREINPDIPEWLEALIVKLHAKDPAERFQSAREVAELLGKRLAEVQQTGQAAAAPVSRNQEPTVTLMVPSRPSPRTGRRWALAAAVVLLLAGGLGITQAPAVMRVLGTVLRIRTPDGTLILEVDDPQVEVTLEKDGQVVIVPPGTKNEIRLKIGEYRMQATKDGKHVADKLVYIKGGRQILQVSWEMEKAGDPIKAPPKAASGKTATGAGTGKVAEINREARLFRGHRQMVHAVAFSPDGKLALSAGGDQPEPDADIRVWDVQSGKLVRRLQGHTRPVMALALSADGKLVLSGGQDKTLRLWDLTTGKEIRRFVGHEGWIYALAFSPDGKLVASGSADFLKNQDNSIRLWDVQTGKEVRRFGQDTGRVTSLAFSPAGNRLVSGGLDGIVRVWDAESGQATHQLSGTGTNVHSVAVSPDGRLVASGHGGSANRAVAQGTLDDPTNCVIILWDLATGKEVRRLRGHRGAVHSVAFSWDSSRLLSGSGGEHFGPGPEIRSTDNTVRLWDVENGRESLRFAGYVGTVTSVAFFPKSKDNSIPEIGLVLSGSYDGTVRLWEYLAGANRALLDIDRRTAAAAVVPLANFAGQSPNGTSAVAFSPDGKTLAFSSFRFIQVFDVATRKEKFTLTGPQHWVWGLAFSPDGKALAAGSWDGSVRVWDLETGKELWQGKGHSDKVWGVAFSPDGKLLASAGEDQTVRLWDAATGRQRPNAIRADSPVYSVAFTPDGQTLVASYWSGTGQLWQVADLTARRAILDGHTAPARLALSPDGRTLLSASQDRTVKVWDLLGSKLRLTLTGHQQPVEAVAVSPYDRLAATVGGEYLNRQKPGEIKLWDLATGQEVASFAGHDGPVFGVAFSPDGKLLATTSADATVKLWTVAQLVAKP